MYSEIKANLWDFKDDIKVITTNCDLNIKGENIMGKGLALQAKIRYPELPLGHGEHIKLNRTGVFYYSKWKIVCFPTKYSWRKKSDLELIRNSMINLYFLMKYNNMRKVIIPKVGCSNGGLDWNVVKRKIMDILEKKDMEFVVVDIV